MTIIFILYICGTAMLNAQDSLVVSQKKPLLHRLGENKIFLTAMTGGPMFGAIALSEKENDKFRELRKQYLPKFSNHTDDYLQYIPIATLYGLKLSGVKSRSSWGRMLTSQALALSLVVSSVNIMKNNIFYWRPDQGGPNSFPSGHTANAFMMATMFAKEYGYKSPWISLGAYSIATATGMMRMANNRHWMRDVVTGAGIGILATEVGYLIADAIFKEKGLNVRDEYIFNELTKPSFLSIYVGKSIPLKGYDLECVDKDKLSGGNTIGIEGAYFFNKFLGAGGRWAVSSGLAAENNNEEIDEDLRYYFMSFSTCLYYSMSISSGLYLSKPLGNRWALGSKLLCDYVTYPTMKYNDITIPRDRGFGFGTGISMLFRARPNYGIKIYADYSLRPPHSANKNEGRWSSLTWGFAFTFLCPQ